MLYYLPQPVVTSVAPFGGPEGGGTVVRVAGQFFVPGAMGAAVGGGDPPFRCRFGALPPTRALSLAAGLVLCSAPAADLVAEPAAFEGVPVAVSMDGGASWSTGTAPRNFTYHGAVEVRGVAPGAGPAGGGTVVTVTGTGFRPWPRLACRFGAATAPASYLSPTALRCVAPPHALQRGGAPVGVGVGVALNGLDFTGAAPPFTYFAPPTLRALAPPSGPRDAPALNITITGESFFGALSPGHPAALACRFDDARAPAAGFINASAVWCVAPTPWPAAPASAAVALSFNGGADWSAPTGSTGGAGALPFTFALPERVLSVAPLQLGEGAREAAVTVTGANFVNSRALRCRFTHAPPPGAANGSALPVVDVAPFWVAGSGALACRLPAAVMGAVFVQVANNGVTFTPKGPALTVVRAPELLAFSPCGGPAAGGTVASLLLRGVAPSAGLLRSLRCVWNGSLHTGALLAPPPAAGAGVAGAAVAACVAPPRCARAP